MHVVRQISHLQVTAHLLVGSPEMCSYVGFQLPAVIGQHCGGTFAASGAPEPQDEPFVHDYRDIIAQEVLCRFEQN
ncbi:hypothetical protein GH733_012991 [Mirounga leonina]|nr:hypothetical protein GH733_012991 [Mirounga leonina]